MNVSDVEFTAGLGGFLVLFGLALVVWFLGRDLSRRLRRMRHREAQRQEQAERQQQAQRESASRKEPGDPSDDEVRQPPE